MAAADSPSLSRRLVTLSVATCLALVATPAAAHAVINKTYFPSTGILIIEGEDDPEPYVMGCSGGDQTLNGNFFFRSSVSRNLYCNEISAVFINGNGGNDTIDTRVVSPAGGYTDIQGSFDFPRAPAHEVWLTGDAGRDTMIGGPLGEHYNDTNSSGERGPDTIRAGGGNDGIYGTDDADTIFAGAGNDRVDPALGADIVHGEGGRDGIDEVPFGKDRDKLFGEAGNDQIFAGGGNDKADGGGGSDYMDGGPGKDRMFGRAGNDGLIGQGGVDFLFGNAGKDYLDGGPAFDRLRGGPGKDELKQ